MIKLLPKDDWKTVTMKEHIATLQDKFDKGEIDDLAIVYLRRGYTPEILVAAKNSESVVYMAQALNNHGMKI